MCWLTFAIGLALGVVLPPAVLYGSFWLAERHNEKRTYWEGGFEDQ